MKLLSIVLFCLVALIGCNPTNEEHAGTPLTKDQVEEAFLKKLSGKCSQRDNHSCVMLKMITYMNRMIKKSNILIGDQIELSKTKEQIVDVDPDDDAALMQARATKSDDAILSVLLAEKLWTFFRSRALRWKAFEHGDIVLSSEPAGKLNIGLSINPQSAIETGRGKLKNIAPIIAAVATKVGLLGALTFKAIVLLVGKALIVSKIALLLAGILAIKKLLTKKYVTYEVVAQPHHHVHGHGHGHEHSHHHGHESHSSVGGGGGWGRALDGFVDGLLTGLPPALATDNDAHTIVYSNVKKD